MIGNRRTASTPLACTAINLERFRRVCALKDARGIDKRPGHAATRHRSGAASRAVPASGRPCSRHLRGADFPNSVRNFDLLFRRSTVSRPVSPRPPCRRSPPPHDRRAEGHRLPTTAVLRNTASAPASSHSATAAPGSPAFSPPAEVAQPERPHGTGRSHRTTVALLPEVGSARLPGPRRAARVTASA